MITVHGRADSSNVQKVLWALDEVGAAWRRIDRGRQFGGLDDPEFRALSPVGRIPVVEDGELALFESNAILRHYGRTWGGPLWPTEPAVLGRAEAVMDWCLSTFWPAVRRPFQLLRDGTDDSAYVAEAITAASAQLDPLAVFVADGAVAGRDFTLADIPPAVVLHRLLWCDATLALPGPVQAWWRACAARPACQTHVTLVARAA
ncbi:MAG: glutathione S-transferase N-terminal domain-containing protein [Pseudomonadota bacterium]